VVAKPGRTDNCGIALAFSGVLKWSRRTGIAFVIVGFTVLVTLSALVAWAPSVGISVAATSAAPKVLTIRRRVFTPPR
jgi:hypothetical protein